MTQENVTIYLNTPLIETQVKGSLSEGITLIKGKIVSESPAGFLVQIKTAGNNRQMLDTLPFKKVFIPAHKIDFMVAD